MPRIRRSYMQQQQINRRRNNVLIDDSKTIKKFKELAKKSDSASPIATKESSCQHQQQQQHHISEFMDPDDKKLKDPIWKYYKRSIKHDPKKKRHVVLCNLCSSTMDGRLHKMRMHLMKECSNITDDVRIDVQKNMILKDRQQQLKSGRRKRIIVGQYCEQIEYENGYDNNITAIFNSNTSCSTVNKKNTSNCIPNKSRKRKLSNTKTTTTVHTVHTSNVNNVVSLQKRNNNNNNTSILEQIFSHSYSTNISTTKNNNSIDSKKMKVLTSPSSLPKISSPSISSPPSVSSSLKDNNNISILERISPSPSSKNNALPRLLRYKHLRYKRKRSNYCHVDNNKSKNSNDDNNAIFEKVMNDNKKKKNQVKQQKEQNEYHDQLNNNNIINNNVEDSNFITNENMHINNNNDKKNHEINKEIIVYPTKSKVIYDFEMVKTTTTKKNQQCLSNNIGTKNANNSITNIDNNFTTTTNTSVNNNLATTTINKYHKDESYINSLTDVLFCDDDEQQHDDDHDYDYLLHKSTTSRKKYNNAYSFNLYYKNMKDKMKLLYPNYNHIRLKKEISSDYRNLSKNDRDYWIQLANTEKNNLSSSSSLFTTIDDNENVAYLFLSNNNDDNGINKSDSITAGNAANNNDYINSIAVQQKESATDDSINMNNVSQSVCENDHNKKTNCYSNSNSCDKKQSRNEQEYTILSSSSSQSQQQNNDDGNKKSTSSEQPAMGQNIILNSTPIPIDDNEQYDNKQSQPNDMHHISATITTTQKVTNAYANKKGYIINEQHDIPTNEEEQQQQEQQILFKNDKKNSATTETSIITNEERLKIKNQKQNFLNMISNKEKEIYQLSNDNFTIQLRINEINHELCVLRDRVYKEQQKQEQELLVRHVQEEEELLLPRQENKFCYDSTNLNNCHHDLHDIQNVCERDATNNNNHQMVVQDRSLSDKNYHHQLGTNYSNTPIMPSHPNTISRKNIHTNSDAISNKLQYSFDGYNNNDNSPIIKSQQQKQQQLSMINKNPKNVTNNDAPSLAGIELARKLRQQDKINLLLLDDNDTTSMSTSFSSYYNF